MIPVTQNSGWRWQFGLVVDKGCLRFQTDVDRDPAAGARMFYEIAMK
jgi:hypothetical protein